MEAPTPIPALAPEVREPEGARVGEVPVEEEDEGEDVVVDVDADGADNAEDGVIPLLVDEVAEDDVAELDAELDGACVVRDCGEGA